MERLLILMDLLREQFDITSLKTSGSCHLASGDTGTKVVSLKSTIHHFQSEIGAVWTERNFPGTTINRNNFETFWLLA